METNSKHNLILEANFLFNQANYFKKEFDSLEKEIERMFESNNYSNSINKLNKILERSRSFLRLYKLYMQKYNKLVINIDSELFNEIELDEVKGHKKKIKIPFNNTYERRQIIKLLSENVQGQHLYEKCLILKGKLQDWYRLKEIDSKSINEDIAEILNISKRNVESALSYGGGKV